MPEKAVHDRTVLHEVLDAATVAHVGVDDSGPVVVPVAFAREGDSVLAHGSSASRLFRRLAEGTPACLTVTVLDGLVAARAAFELSMNYRSVMVFGAFAEVTDPAAKSAALRALTEKLMPGRWADVRPPNDKELLATTILRLPLTECSIKISDKGPDDNSQDRQRPVWAGVIPVHHALGKPVPDADVPAGVAVPSYVSRWRA